MLSIASILLLAVAATAETTTSLWLPDSYTDFGYDDDFVESFKASVVSKSGDKVTLAIGVDPETTTFGTRTRIYEGATPTLTWIGASSFQSASTYTNRWSTDRTYALDCSLEESTKALCTESTAGSNMYSSYCSYYYSYYTATGYTTTRVITYSNPPTKVTQIETRTPATRSIPSYCKSGSTLPASLYTSTYTVRVVTYPVIITAGEDRLSETSASTPSDSTATPTGSQNGAGPGISDGPAATQAGNAAGPMGTLAPALAGLGAAAAIFF
ncbi:hypothetical protein P280DRAFT_468477 [Massarina eburnea CBS 473.64]|uniref:Uncharacterized protein n=1 Tax=Massarina eburnea CBS 473.64 TaxID=1395130 RepID=A0A6A6S3Y7_9PLEO|nr:hypothetical protein P280DRAFT_468477 [Massarina eburnea CBS 473.64]